MSRMLKTHQNTIGNVMIALLFVGGCIFLLTGSWDAPETEAANGCCGGDMTATTLTAASAGGCCGGANKLTDDSGCNCLSSVGGSNCNTMICADATGCGQGSNKIKDGCKSQCGGNKNKCKKDGCCATKICKNDTKCADCDHINTSG